MTFRIQLYNQYSKRELISALSYLYPNEFDNLCNKFDELYKNINFIQIEDDVISFYNDFIKCYTLDENTFIDIIYQLKKCNDKTFIIEVKQSEYELLINCDKRFESEYTNAQIHTYMFNDDNVIEIDKYKIMFFEKIIKVEFNEFIRGIKLKQIL